VIVVNKIRRSAFGRGPSQSGYSLLELIITLTVLAILIVGTVPLAQNAARRQKEVQLRETLRMVRNAIDEFKRDTLGACTAGQVTTTDPTRRGIGGQRGQGGNIPTDPRSRVVIDDCTIFDTENVDRYPPSLETLVDGVKVRERGINAASGRGLGSDTTQATEINETQDLIKRYLREMPVDPMTGESDWKLRSSYQDADSDTWDTINVFDISSASDAEGLNGEKYSDW
jgi:general secretion pathway protein G